MTILGISLGVTYVNEQDMIDIDFSRCKGDVVMVMLGARRDKRRSARLRLRLSPTALGIK